MFKNFYQEIENLSIQNYQIEQKREILKGYIDNFVDKVTNVDISNLKKNPELYNLFDNTLSKIQQNTINWQNYFNKLLELEKFESFLKNYFIVMVFGKVKAGKSSLGNFIANNSEKKAEFFRYENAKQKPIEKFIEEFATNNLECTSEIQGFKLGALAWIDTPGLGSMTKENENLAKKYVDSADYIIYPTNSAQPLQRDEIEELKELFKQNKKISICITKSDKMINARDKNQKLIKENGKIKKIRVNKSKEDRKAQEEYVYNEIKKIADENLIGDIFSISVLTAKEGLETNNQELLKNSNMEQFYNLLTQIVSKKANSFKQNKPYEGLVGFIENRLLDNLNSLNKDFKEIENILQDNIKKFGLIKTTIKNEIAIKVEEIVSSYKINKQNIKETFTKIDKQLSEKIPQIIAKKIQEILVDFDAKVSNLEFSYDLEVKELYQVITTTYETTSFPRKLLSIITFGLVSRTYTTTTKKIPIGDNLFDVITSAKEDRVEQFIQIAHHNYTEVENLFNDFLDIVTKLKEELNTLQTQSIQLSNSLKG
jgi:hypothetical protein